MTYDEEVYAAHLKIRTWYLEFVKKYKRELPRDLFQVTKQALDKVLAKANAFHRERDLKALEKMAREEILFFFLPWEVVIWYAQQKKPKQ